MPGRPGVAPAPADPDEAIGVYYGAMSEADLVRQVRLLAHRLGWAFYHSFLSVRSTPGLPDLILARPPRLVLAECKTTRGRVTPAQLRWLRLLQDCPCETYVFRPQDLPDVGSILQTGATPGMRCVQEVRDLLAPAESPAP